MIKVKVSGDFIHVPLKELDILNDLHYDVKAGPYCINDDIESNIMYYFIGSDNGKSKETNYVVNWMIDKKDYFVGNCYIVKIVDNRISKIESRDATNIIVSLSEPSSNNMSIFNKPIVSSSSTRQYDSDEDDNYVEKGTLFFNSLFCSC